MYVQNKRRKHDISIMDMIAKQTIYKVTEKQKERINCVRMFLGVQFLSEICTVNGDAFAPGIMDGKMKDDDIDNLIYRTKLSTPIQPKPNTYSWKKWSKLLSTLTTRSSTTRLQQKLGKWYQSHSESGRWLVKRYPGVIPQDMQQKYNLFQDILHIALD